MARELETGTYRMVWNQTVSRRRWLLVKLGVGGATAVSAACLLSLVLTQWASPIDKARANVMTPLVFPTRGVVPIGYAVLAFAIGVVAGLVLRRTLPAMAATLLLVAGVQLGAAMVRPLISAPVHRVSALTSQRVDMLANYGNGLLKIVADPSERDAWELSNKVVAKPGGHEFDGPADAVTCGGDGDCDSWVLSHHLLVEETYVPAKRFWTVQWRELAILIGLTGCMSLISLWWIRRRLA